MNKIHYFIKNILQNSKLNTNKQSNVNYKKKYNMVKLTNINYLNVTREIIVLYLPLCTKIIPNGPNRPNRPNVIFVLLLGCYYYGSDKSFDYINPKK